MPVLLLPYECHSLDQTVYGMLAVSGVNAVSPLKRCLCFIAILRPFSCALPFAGDAMVFGEIRRGLKSMLSHPHGKQVLWSCLRTHRSLWSPHKFDYKGWDPEALGGILTVFTVPGCNRVTVTTV